MLNRLLPILFAALCGPLCLFLALSMPTGEVPDEPAHALRADSLWHGEVMGYRGPAPDQDGRLRTSAGVTANSALVDAGFAFAGVPLKDRHLSLPFMAKLAAVPWQVAARFAAVPNTAVYLPVVYVPAALGIGVARELGRGPFAAILAGRVGNALAFLALGSLALALAGAAQVVLFIGLSLPMTLALAGSVNPDGLLIATAALGVAALTRCTGTPRWPPWLAGTCLAVLGAAKPCYLPLALAMLAPLALRGVGWAAVLRVLAVAAPGLLWSGAAAAFVATPFFRAAYLPGPLWPGDPTRSFDATDPGAQLLVLLHAPWRLLTLPIAAMREQPASRFASIVGVLGQLDLVLPVWLYQAWLAAMLSGGAADLCQGARDRRGIGPFGAVMVAAGVLASALAVYLLQYLSWTSVGAAAIDGVQGRYFLPLLPFAGLVLTALRPAGRPRLRRLLASLPIVLAAVDSLVVARLVVTTYYLR